MRAPPDNPSIPGNFTCRSGFSRGRYATTRKSRLKLLLQQLKDERNWCLTPIVLAILVLLPIALPAAGLPWDNYPDGDGRQESYALCSGCHSFELVAQQGMSRDRWEETLHWMTEKQGMGALPPTLHNLVLDYLAQAFPENQLPTTSRYMVGATLESLPLYEGRNETFAVCSACHSMRLVAQQGLDRDSWDETLGWMAEEQGMAELPADLREKILGYLVWAFPAERPN